MKDNQDVRAGGLSLKINPEPFRIELDREEANYELTKANAQKANEEVTIASDRVASRQTQLDDPKLHSNARPSSASLERLVRDATRWDLSILDVAPPARRGGRT